MIIWGKGDIPLRLYIPPLKARSNDSYELEYTIIKLI